MKHPEVNEIEFQLAVARVRGQSMYRRLAGIFDLISFSPQLIRQFGAICFDVEYGQEIEMLRPFTPAQIIVTEYLHHLTDAERNESCIKQQVIESLGKGLNVQTLYDYASYIIDAHPNLQLGLCTRLNAFPEELYYEHIVAFLQAARRIVVPGGCIIISCQEAAYIELLDKAQIEGVDGLKILVIDERDNSLTSLGSGILVGVKHA